MPKGIDISELTPKQLNDLICNYLTQGYDYVVKHHQLYLFKIV